MTATAANMETPEERVSYLRAGHTLRSWLLSTDHKRIGILYFVATSLALSLGGVFALLLRIEHLTPNRTIVDAITYNRLFTLHGITMVWLFMIPSIPAAFGNFFKAEVAKWGKVVKTSGAQVD